MRTNSLKELGTMPGKFLEGSYKRGSPFIKSWTATEDEKLEQAIRCTYRKTIKNEKEMLVRRTTLLYGKPVYYPERLTTSKLSEFRKLMVSTGNGIVGVVWTIHQAMGYPCAFFNRDRSPIEIDRIISCYHACMKGTSTYELEKILYF